MVFDTENDAGNKPNENDFALQTCRNSEGKSNIWNLYQGADTKSNWRSISIPRDIKFQSGLTSVNDPYEPGRDHVVLEVAMPLSFLHKQDRYGFGMGVLQNLPDGEFSGITGTWPPNISKTFTDFIPNKFGDLIDPLNQVSAPPIPVISVSEKSLSLGNVEVSEKSSPRAITISNIGTSILIIKSVRAPNEFTISGISTPTEIAPGEKITFDVTFAPIRTGEKSGKIMISSNDLSNPSLTISIDGKGIEKGAPPLGGGCLIATATFGSELAPQVQMLREIRDNVVLSTELGTSFMNGFNQFYYSFSPTIADLERENSIFKEAVKLTITPLLTTLSILNYVDIDSEEEMLGYGIGIIMLNVGMYFGIPAFAILRIKKL